MHIRAHPKHSRWGEVFGKCGEARSSSRGNSVASLEACHDMPDPSKSRRHPDRVFPCRRDPSLCRSKVPAVVIERIDLIVGGLRAAELVNEFRRRLREQDLLPDRAALAVACTAYADGCVYVVVAAGQIWKRIATGGSGASEVQIVRVCADSFHGHYVVCREACGILVDISFDELDSQFVLTRWPSAEGSC